MKVLKNNYKGIVTHESNVKIKPYPRKLICEKCDSELQYDVEDLEEGVYGAMHVTCPLCGHSNMLDGDEHDVTITKDNIKFPTHFHHTSVETGAVDNCNAEHVKKCVKKAIKYFRENKDEFAYATSSGTTTVHVFRYTGDEEYEVVVSKDYYSTYIKFEPEDYGENEDRFQTVSLGTEW